MAVVERSSAARTLASVRGVGGLNEHEPAVLTIWLPNRKRWWAGTCEDKIAMAEQRLRLAAQAKIVELHTPVANRF